MQTTYRTKAIHVQSSEIEQMIREYVIMKMPHLATEEFEIYMKYDGASYTVTAIIDVVDPG